MRARARRFVPGRQVAMVAALTAACLTIAVLVSRAHASDPTLRPLASTQAHAPGHPGAVVADVEPGGGCNTPEPGECVEDPKTHCPIKGPLHASGSEVCVPIEGTVIVRVGYPPGGGCNQEEVIQVAVPPAGEQFEAAWYSELGEATRWWQSPGEPSPIANGAATYTVPPGYAGWSGAGGSGGSASSCSGLVPEKTFGVKAWALTSGKGSGGGSGGGGGAGGGTGGGRCLVPKLRRLTLTAAKRSLTSHRCRLGKVQRKRSAAALRGRVLSQTVRAGRTLPAGAKVGVTLGR
jgi:hypothetical protein